MSKSHLVWAERFKLLELKSQREGTYNEKGSKESLGSSLVVRSYAESRNAQPNNEIYVFDEEKTSELMAVRDTNIKKQSDEKSKKKESTEEVLANAIVKALGKEEKPKSETAKQIDFDALKVIIRDEDLGIRIKKDDTLESVESRIEEARAKK